MHSEGSADDLTSRTYSELTIEGITRLSTRLKENGQRIMKRKVVVLQEQIKAEALYCSNVEQELKNSQEFVQNGLKSQSLTAEEKDQWLNYFSKPDADIESVLESYQPPQRDMVLALYNVATMPASLAEYQHKVQLHTGMLDVASELIKVYGSEIEFSKRDEAMYAAKRDRLQKKRASQLKKTRDKLLLLKQIAGQTSKHAVQPAEVLEQVPNIIDSQDDNDIINFIENL